MEGLLRVRTTPPLFPGYGGHFDQKGLPFDSNVAFGPRTYVPFLFRFFFFFDFFLVSSAHMSRRLIFILSVHLSSFISVSFH